MYGRIASTARSPRTALPAIGDSTTPTRPPQALPPPTPPQPPSPPPPPPTDRRLRRRRPAAPPPLSSPPSLPAPPPPRRLCLPLRPSTSTQPSSIVHGSSVAGFRTGQLVPTCSVNGIVSSSLRDMYLSLSSCLSCMYGHLCQYDTQTKVNSKYLGRYCSGEGIIPQGWVCLTASKIIAE